MDLGQQLAEEGIRRSRKGANPAWSLEMYGIGLTVARGRDRFTTNDMRDLHDRIGKHNTSNWSSLGGVMRDLARAKIIKPTGVSIRSTRASHRGRPVRVWKSLVF